MWFVVHTRSQVNIHNNTTHATFNTELTCIVEHPQFQIHHSPFLQFLLNDREIRELVAWLTSEIMCRERFTNNSISIFTKCRLYTQPRALDQLDRLFASSLHRHRRRHRAWSLLLCDGSGTQWWLKLELSPSPLERCAITSSSDGSSRWWWGERESSFFIFQWKRIIEEEKWAVIEVREREMERW